jgi:hypothetical protein
MIPCRGWCQFTDPHYYDNTPIGMNQFELDYGYTRSDALIDESEVDAGARIDLNEGDISYTRYFSFLHRVAWFNPTIPFAGVEGSISGTPINKFSTGTGDSSYQAAMLLLGGPALTVEQYANTKPTSTLGVSLTVTAPTGAYDSNELLNLGENRWSFKPEIAVSYPFGTQQRWEFDAYANSFYYTDNNAYHGAATLRQRQFPGVEGHISYSFTDNFWVSLDTRYSFGADSFVNGTDQHDSQHNFILGSEADVSLNMHNSLTFEIAKAIVHRNGPVITGFIVKYDYVWGKGYK